jgi:hypothetical protein
MSSVKHAERPKRSYCLTGNRFQTRIGHSVQSVQRYLNLIVLASLIARRLHGRQNPNLVTPMIVGLPKAAEECTDGPNIFDTVHHRQGQGVAVTHCTSTSSTQQSVAAVHTDSRRPQLSACHTAAPAALGVCSALAKSFWSSHFTKHWCSDNELAVAPICNRVTYTPGALGRASVYGVLPQPTRENLFNCVRKSHTFALVYRFFLHGR